MNIENLSQVDENLSQIYENLIQKETKYIYSHLGLGDHVICNALYRELMDDNKNYILFVKKQNITTVKFMLRDLKNLNIQEVEDDNEVIKILSGNIQKTIIIGFCSLPYPGAKDFDDSFYLQHGIDFEKRWSGFICDRNLKSERILFEKFGVKEGEYVFVHDDVERGYEIDESYIINKDLPIIRPNKKIDNYYLSNNSFDYCYLMQHSKESHFIDSSFRLIFDSLELRNDNIFFHVNLKNGINRGYLPHSKLNFKII
jgi:Cft2 family RNA processing exonuclease